MHCLAPRRAGTINLAGLTGACRRGAAVLVARAAPSNPTASPTPSSAPAAPTTPQPIGLQIVYVRIHSCKIPAAHSLRPLAQRVQEYTRITNHYGA